MNLAVSGLQSPAPRTGWRSVSVGEVCRNIEYGLSVSANAEIATPKCLRITDIQNGAVDWESVPGCVITKKDEEEHQLEDGDIVFARTGGTTGKSYLLHKPPERAVFASYLIRLRASDAVLPEFLYAFFQSESYWQQVRALSRGGAQPNVNSTLLRSIKLPLPSRADQELICRAIRAQLETASRARAAAEAQLDAAHSLLRSDLGATFNRAEDRAGTVVALSEVLRQVQDVIHPYEKPSGIVTFVGLEHIERDSGVRTGSVQLEMAELTGRKPRFLKGQIVYGYLRPYLNKVWIAEFDGLCSVDQYVYEVDSQVADTNYLAWFMRSPVYLKRAPISTSPGQLPRIRTEEVGAVKVKLPSLETQARIASAIEERQRLYTRIRRSIQDQLDTFDSYQRAVLRRAFNGEA